jgi:hypothetical protein
VSANCGLEESSLIPRVVVAVRSDSMSESLIIHI